jgi:hypothetical protein
MGVQMTESRGMDAEDVPLILFPTLTLEAISGRDW